MPFPIIDEHKRLKHKVDQFPDPIFSSQTPDRGVRTGVIYDIVQNSDNTKVWLAVVPLWPQSIQSTGELKFQDLKVNPMGAITGGSPENPVAVRYVKVYPTSIAPNLATLYYQKGQIIDYHAHYGAAFPQQGVSGVSGHSGFSGVSYIPTQYEQMQGTYVTTLEDISFWARISQVTPPGYSSGSSCNNYPTPSLQSNQYAYQFTAVIPKYNQSVPQLMDMWEDYFDGQSQYYGICYNTADVFAPSGTPLSKQIVKVYPFLNPDPEACVPPANADAVSTVWTYWFFAGGSGGVGAGQYQYQVYMMVAQNQPGWDFVRAHPMIG